MTTIRIHAIPDGRDYRVNCWDGDDIDQRWLIRPAVESNVTRAVRDRYGVTPQWTYDNPILRGEMSAEITIPDRPLDTTDGNTTAWGSTATTSGWWQS
jgi:hypothetical protein